LHLTPNFESFTFAGTCDITFKVDTDKLDEETNGKEITLHAKELSISSASYVILSNETTSSAAPAVVPATEIHTNLKATTVKFIFATSIPKTTANDETQIRLSIVYTGCLNNQMAGFYRSSYTDITGQSKFMASTQFESLDARRCFPCVDEPAAKAVFGVKLTIASHLTALSNMPVASLHTLSSTTKSVTFLDTPVMSTYLLAMCVGEFDCSQALTSSGILVSVYTPPGKADMGAFALDTARQSLSLYNDFFGVPYPLPKLDMIAIPEFAMGAMEVSGNCECVCVVC
jgi:aminopeptidase N